jgi:hypothetical protein
LFTSKCSAWDCTACLVVWSLDLAHSLARRHLRAAAALRG